MFFLFYGSNVNPERIIPYYLMGLQTFPDFLILLVFFSSERSDYEKTANIPIFTSEAMEEERKICEVILEKPKIQLIPHY